MGLLSRFYTYCGIHNEYNPASSIDELCDMYGDKVILILGVYNGIDPLHVYYGEDVNPDEYLHYVRRFCESYVDDGGLRVYQSVKNSFHKEQLDNGDVTVADIGLIANMLRSYGL